MKTKISTDESTYCAFLQAMYKYSRLPPLTHNRSTYARRLKLIQIYIYHKTGRLHPIRSLVNQANALKSKDSHANLVKSEVTRGERTVSPEPASPTTTHSTDPVDYNHTVLPRSPGISRRRPKLVIPTLRNQLPSNPTSNHRSSSTDSQLELQSPPLFSLLLQGDMSPSLPRTPLDQITHTPPLPPEMPRFSKAKTNLRIALAHQSSSEYYAPVLSPDASQDPASPLFPPLDTRRPRSDSANSRPMLRPRQLSYLHSIPAVSDSISSPKLGNTSDTGSSIPRTESLASPLILFQPSLSSGLKRSLN